MKLSHKKIESLKTGNEQNEAESQKIESLKTGNEQNEAESQKD